MPRWLSKVGREAAAQRVLERIGGVAYAARCSTPSAATKPLQYTEAHRFARYWRKRCVRSS